MVLIRTPGSSQHRDKGGQFMLRVKGGDSVAAPNVLSTNEDIWHRALRGQLLQSLLNSGSISCTSIPRKPHSRPRRKHREERDIVSNDPLWFSFVKRTSHSHMVSSSKMATCFPWFSLARRALALEQYPHHVLEKLFGRSRKIQFNSIGSPNWGESC